MGQAQMERKELFAVATLRQLFPAPLLGTQLVMVDPVASQVPVLAAPPQALCVSLSSAPPAPVDLSPTVDPCSAGQIGLHHLSNQHILFLIFL